VKIKGTPLNVYARFEEKCAFGFKGLIDEIESSKNDVKFFETFE